MKTLLTVALAALALAGSKCPTPASAEPATPAPVVVPVIPEHVDPPLHMGDDEKSCWRSVAPFQALATEYGAMIVCQPAFQEWNGLAGVYSGGMVSIVAWPGTDEAYYREAVAHELGHAWVYDRFDTPEHGRAMAILGWTDWHGEEFADIFAVNLGFWRDYGDGWRHPGGHYPTQDTLDALVAAGLLPEVNR